MSAVKELSVLKNVPNDILGDLEKMSRLRSYNKNQRIYSPGREKECVGFVLQGVLRMQKLLYDGREHIIGLLAEGDMFGQVFDGPRTFTIEAATNAKILEFKREPFKELLLRSPELEQIVFMNVLNELDRARDWMILLANPRIRGRLAGFLLILASRFANIDHVVRKRREGSLDVQIPINRLDLAHLLGTRRETISRAFHALADNGHISITRSDLIRIHDIEVLAEEAGIEESGISLSLKDLTMTGQKSGLSGRSALLATPGSRGRC